jgi:catechol 2,3-dioxygenase-like lactoylglutathione lyase family enzyme
MLGNKDAAANIAVRDLERAKKFYQDTMGLTPVGAEGQEVVVFEWKLEGQRLSVSVYVSIQINLKIFNPV